MQEGLAKLQPEAAADAPRAAPVEAAGAAANAPIPSEAELMEMISEAAYYRAEKRGFVPGLEAEDWVQAEADVLQRLNALRGRIRP